MKNIVLIQSLSWRQWSTLWSAYWRIWPIVLRIKFKQFFKDAQWLSRKVTFVDISNEAPQVFSEPQSCKQQDEIKSQLRLAIELHELVRLAARLHFFRAECLPRSIVLVDLLKRRGISASTMIGVSKQGTQLASHAWAEVNGIAVVEPESLEQNFTVLKR